MAQNIVAYAAEDDALDFADPARTHNDHGAAKFCGCINDAFRSLTIPDVGFYIAVGAAQFGADAFKKGFSVLFVFLLELFTLVSPDQAGNRRNAVQKVERFSAGNGSRQLGRNAASGFSVFRAVNRDKYIGLIHILSVTMMFLFSGPVSVCACQLPKSTIFPPPRTFLLCAIFCGAVARITQPNASDAFFVLRQRTTFVKPPEKHVAGGVMILS